MSKEREERLDESPRVPLVSVCIPTHNRRETLAGVLEMLEAQTFQDFEIIVCDDGSIDGTHEFLCALDWSRLVVLRNAESVNYPATMKRLFDLSRGHYIAVQHDHDSIEPAWLERMVSLMAAHPTASMGCCACRFIGSDGSVVEEGSAGLFKVFPRTGVLPGPEFIRVLATKIHTPLAVTGCLFRRDIVMLAGGYRSEWYLASDEDLYRRVAIFGDALFCPERLLTLTARSQASAANLGSWRAIYTLYEFRRDTALNFMAGAPTVRRVLAWRMEALKAIAVAREVASLWLRGDFERLRDGLRVDLVPPLPTRRPPLGQVARFALWITIATLSRTPRMAKVVGRVRHRLRGKFGVNN